MQSVKGLIYTHPPVYDLLKRLKRGLIRQSDPAYDWFNAYSAKCGTVRFIQIGASDGLRNDPIREFVLRDRWQGVFIEPLPGVFQLLKHNYRRQRGLTFLNAAISSEEGTLVFWTFDDSFLDTLPLELRMEYLRKASAERAHVTKFLNGAPESVLTQINVPCTTISKVVKNHLPQGFDLLVIDAEGHEARIIESINFNEVRPKAIFFESHHIKAQMPHLIERLDSAGYSIREIRGDCIAE